MSDNSNQTTWQFLISKEGRPILIGTLCMIAVTVLIGVWVYNALFKVDIPERRDPFKGAQVGSSQVDAKNLPSNRADLTSEGLTPEAEAVANRYNEKASADPNMHPIPTKADVIYIPDGLPTERSDQRASEGQTVSGLPQETTRQNIRQQNEALERERQAYEQQRIRYFASILTESSTPSRIAKIQLAEASTASSARARDTAMHVGVKDGLPVVIDETKANQNMLVKASDIVFGVSDIALNSDFKGPVRVTFLQGKLDGWTGLGSFETSQEGLKLKLKITTVVSPTGKTYQTEAYVLDPQTTLWAMATNVDRHLIYRYGGWGLHKVFSTFGKVAEQSAVATSSVNSDGGSQTTYRELDDRQLLFTLGGEIGDLLADIFKDNLSRQPTIEVAPNEQLGVMFMSTLYE